jgi:DNA-binding MarR family transcriptional regulator
MTITPVPNDAISDAIRGDSIAVLGERYQGEYDWADPAAVQLCLRVDAASAAHKSAANRLVQSLGIDRMTDRYSVLRALYFSRDHRLSQAEIGNDIRVNSSNVTYLVDGLEKDSLVRRGGHPSDRRVSLVELTPEGEALCAVLISSMAKLMKALAETFSEEEKLLFNRFLERFRQHAESLQMDRE